MVQPFEGAPRESEMMIKHHRVGIFDPPNQFLLAEGVEGLNIGNAAENAPLGLQRVLNEIRDNHFRSVAHRRSPRRSRSASVR